MGLCHQVCPHGTVSSVNPFLPPPHPAVTPPPPQPIPSSSIVSTSLVTDLEGLTLTDTSLTPTVSVPHALLGGVPGSLSPVGGSWALCHLQGLQGALSSPRCPPVQLLSPAFSAVKTYELLHRMAGEGLAVEYCFSRRPFPSDPHMVAVQIQISNNTDTEVKNLRVNETKPLSGMRIQEFPEIGMTRHGMAVMLWENGDRGWVGTWDVMAALWFQSAWHQGTQPAW